MRKLLRPALVALVGLLLCACVLALADSGVERDEDGGTWDWDRGIYTAPDGTTYSISQDGDTDTTPTGGSSGGDAMVIDTGERDPLAGIEKNPDGSITVESGQGGVDIEIEPTRAPLTPEEWQDLLHRAELRNGSYTPTFNTDPATGAITEVTVRYMGIGRSMVVLDGRDTLVNTVNLSWTTEAPENKVLAVIDTPRTGYAWLRMKPNNKKTTAKLEQCRLNQVVRVLAVGKHWTFVDHNGTRGYIQTSSLEFYANDHESFTSGALSVKGKTSGRDTCNVRSSDKTHRVLMNYPLGTQVTVFDILDDEWAEVDICGWHCMVNTKFLTIEKETASAN